jgi:dihydropteroate synthase
MHLLGRLESFKSFALPMCIAMPRLIPYADQFLSDNKTLSLTASLFCSRINEVKIIRTQDVSDASMAIGFWQLMTIKTRPYRLSKVFVRRLRTIRDSLRLMRKGLIKK